MSRDDVTALFELALRAPKSTAETLWLNRMIADVGDNWVAQDAHKRAEEAKAAQENQPVA